MTEPIIESGMNFGPYVASDLFHIEKSDLLKHLRKGDKKGIKTVEFILRWKDKEKEKLLFIEARTTAPHPGTPPTDDKKGFPGFIEDISAKFTHSLEVFFSAILKRCDDISNEIPQGLDAATCSKSQCDIILVLVIKNHEDKRGLNMVKLALQKSLLREIKIWGLSPESSSSSIMVLNEDMAREKHLIQ